MLSFKTLVSLEDNITYMRKGLNFITIQFEFLKIDILDQYFVMLYIFIGKYKRLTSNQWISCHKFTGKVKVHVQEANTVCKS